MRIGDLSNDHNGSGVRFKEIRSTGEILTIGYSQQVIIEDQYVYSVYGMAEHENEMDVYRLDLRTKNWELLCQAKGHYVNNTHKLKHNMALYNNKIYLFGGAYYPCSNHTVRFISLFQVSCILCDILIINYFIFLLLFSRKYIFLMY